ncbi:MAG: PHP domain-containing protein [Armatimonadota bacterium]|nr:PHP domain-containing protein [Armatimonadota bacterium]
MLVTGDYHMHTTYSDGRATVAEMVAAGRRAGLAEVAITDHGPRNIGVGVASPATYRRIRQEVREAETPGGPRVLLGAEADVLGREGQIDLPEEVYRELDILLVGLHPFVWPADAAGGWLVAGNALSRWSRRVWERVRRANTEALCRCLSRHPVDVVTHPGLGMPVDVAAVARACARTGTAYEVNVGHLYQTVDELRVAAAEGAFFIVNSDAHFPASVGRLDAGLRLLAEAGVPPERVLNTPAGGGLGGRRARLR